MRIATVGLIAGASLTFSAAHAQWSNDPAVNLAIGDFGGEQIQPKVRLAADGGCYISWFDNSAGGYDPRLQRLNAAGVEQWAHNGLLIRDRSLSSTQDYGLAVDAAGNAIIVFNDDLNANAPITAQKVSPAGVVQWGASGLQVSGTQTGFKGPPFVTVLSDGNIAVAWSNGSILAVNVQKLDSNGTPLWPMPIVLTDASRPFNLCGIEASNNGGMVVSFVRCTGTNCITSNKHLYAQKIDASGAQVWDRDPGTPGVFDPVIVFDATSLQTGTFPPFVSDSAGGAVFTYYETGGNRDAYVQHISASGAEVFPHNGVSVSTQANRLQLSMSGAYDPATGDTYTAWVESNATQSMWAFYAQKISAAGARQWTDNGVELLALSGVQPSFPKSLLKPCGGALAFVQRNTGVSTGDIVGFCLDTSGGACWAFPPLSISTQGAKSRLDGTMTSGPSAAALLAWSDNRADANNVYAQRINLDGTLGNPAFCPADINQSGAVSSQDIFDFLAFFFANNPRADFNRSCAISSQDIFDFLAAFFSPCP